MKHPRFTVVIAVAAASLAAAGPAHAREALTVAEAVAPVLVIDQARVSTVPAAQIDYATALKLFNYPDRGGERGERLVREAAAHVTVSRDGRTWRFAVRKGLRLSSGEKVDGASFATAIRRVKNPAVVSPADDAFRNIVGVAAHGNSLTLRLRHPDSSVPYLLATPYAQAVPHVLANVPLPINVYPTGGPFYPAQSVTGRIVLRENPFYTGARHAHFGEIDILYNPDLVAVRDAIEHGTVDYANVNLLSPPNQDALAAKYGVHRGRFQVHPSAETDYVALNTLRSVFGQPRLRRAASQVIDREELAKFNGRFSASAADHILPGALSTIAQKPVYNHSSANLPAATKLADGHCGDLSVYTTNGPTGMAYGQAMTTGLDGIGCSANLLAFTPFEYGQRVDTPGEPYDAAIFRTSRFFDFGDPLNFMENVMDPARRPPHGPNYSNVAEQGIRRHLQAMRDFYAGGMSDDEILEFLRKRNTKISKFETAELRERPPWVTIDNPNDREFFSKNLRPSSLVYHSITGGADYVKMAPR